MEKNSHYVIVGIFVVASLTALAMFIIWLAGTHDSRNYARYMVHFEDPVSGLKQGAVVQYRGVEVGRVRGIHISEKSLNLIEVGIEIDEDTPITQSSEASLATQGFTGIVFIELTTREDGARTPLQVVAGQDYPVIPGRGTQMSKLFQDVPAITKQILTITEKLNTIMNDENRAALEQTLQNVAQTSAAISMLLNEENIGNTSEALRNLSSASGDMSQLVSRFNKTADEIDKAVHSLNAVLTDNKGDIDKFAGSGLRQITQMASETREMAKSIRRLADTIEQEPSRLLYQPNYRGVEIKE